ncbi:hypothetical protein KHP62_06035 [Rhodobacteraceae bacterium NNCM2]|nr:hypothetical protein [Coraliihabitans acroporae]
MISVFYPERESGAGLVSGGLSAVLTAAILILFAVHAYYFRSYVTDDAYISFRYLDHFLDGHGLVYNVGERVWGYTNFLWVILLAPLVAAGLDPLVAAQMLGILLDLAILLIVLTGVWAPAAERRFNPIGGLLLAVNGAFVLQGWSGLETSLFTLLLLLAFMAVSRAVSEGLAAWWFLFACMMVLATMTRPEGVVAFLGFVVFALCELRGRAGLGWLWAVVPYCALIAVYLAAMHGYYGVVWPNSLDAKVGSGAEQFLRGAHYLKSFILGYPVVLLTVALALVAIRRATWAEIVAIAFCICFTIFYTSAGGDWMYGYRMYHPVIAFSACLVPLALTLFLSWRWLGLGLAVVAVAATAAQTKLNPQVQAAARESYVHQGIKVGKWMAENLPPDSLIATNTAGTVAYFAGTPILDMMGLNDVHIAAREEVPAAWKGIEKGDGAYILSRQPDFIHFGSSTGSDEPVFLSDVELYQSDDFWRQYALEVIAIDDRTKLKLYRKREVPGTEVQTEEERAARAAVVEKRMKASSFRY